MHLVNLNNAVRYVATLANVPPTFLEALEIKIRESQQLINAVWATQFVESGLAIEDIDVKASFGDGYIELEFPYWAVTKSNMYCVYGQRLFGLARLVDVTTGWHYLIGKIIQEYPSFPFEVPLTRAVVDITVLVPNNRQRDGDHFWFRPILDGLVQNRVISNDTTSNVDITFHYRPDRDHPGVIVQVRPGVQTSVAQIRSATLVQVT